MMPNSAWIRIYTANDAIEAHVVASALNNAGIETQLRPADPGGFGPALPTLDQANTVCVRQDDAEEARAIIENAADSETGRLSLSESVGGDLGLPDEDA